MSNIVDRSRQLSARNPRTGERDYPFFVPDDAALQEASTALRAAQPAWAAMDLSGRIAALQAFSATIAARGASITAALEIDTGRRRLAQIEIAAVIDSIAAWTARVPTLVTTEWVIGRAMPAIRHTAQFVPYPLIGVVSPWNFPLLLGMIDAIPALLAGCAVIVKPSEVTPRFIDPLIEAIAAIPLLRDVFRIVPGDGVTGQALIDQIDFICFTGSVATGRKVALQAAARLIPACLELGGKDPLIVLDGADLEAATDAALRGSVSATGQACQSIERIYVARPIHDAFVALLVRKAKTTRLNWPDIERGEIGPLIFERQAEIIAAQLDDAREHGAKMLCGGEIERHGGGLWLRPTVLTDVNPEMLVMTEETFGPVMPVVPFDTIDEAVACANSGAYGLSAAVFAETLDEAEAVGRRLEAGAISLNDAALTALFHEAGKQSFKSSGLGPSRMGAEGYLRFFRRKALIANTGRPVPLSAFREDQM